MEGSSSNNGGSGSSGSSGGETAPAPVNEEETGPEMDNDGENDEGADSASGEEGQSEAQESSTPKQEQASASASSSSQRGLVDFKQWDSSAYEKIREFYDLDSTALPAEAFFVREDQSQAALKNPNYNKQPRKGSSGAPENLAKSVYFLPESARRLLRGDKVASARLKVVTAGVKVFEKKVLRNGEVDYRLMQEGIAYVAPHISKRMLQVS